MPPQLGDPLDDDIIIYRAFAAKGFRERPSKVRAKAYLRWEDHADGLSMGRTPLAAVAGLETNYGYCSISVGAIHGLPYNIKACPRLDDPDHILLCNIPYLMESDRERGMAQEIAGRLAKLSKVETCDAFPPKKAAEKPVQLP